MSEDRKTVVVVDDEHEITDLYKSFLEDEFNVLEFNQPEAFLKYLKFHDPDRLPFHALITDYRMPKMTGMDMISEGIKLGYRFPYILLSGHLDKNTVMRAVDTGAFKLLEKPTPPNVLYETVKKLILNREIETTRNQVRSLLAKLHENYSFLRLTLLNYIPEEAFEKMIVHTGPDGKVIKSESFEELMQSLESRLDCLLQNESRLDESTQKAPLKTAV